MKRLVAVTLALAVAPLIAQSPAGWKLRVDRSQSATDPDAAGDIKFVKQGAGFHCTNPTAAVYWNPANTATGSYTLKGTFTLMKPSGHTNYYGLVFGGSSLEGADQAYVYFMVAQDGSFAPGAPYSATASDDTVSCYLGALSAALIQIV